MAGLPWYAIWSEFSRHGKTRDLCARVKDRNAGMYVIRLFEHCADQALDGRIPASVIEEVAAWRGKDGALLAALEAVGILDIDGETRVVHGWVERNGSRIRKWLDDNAKPRGNRKNPPAVPYGTDAGLTRDTGGTTSGSSGVDGRSEIEKKTKKLARLQRARRAGGEPESTPEAAEPVGPPPPAEEAVSAVTQSPAPELPGESNAARANAATPEGSAPAARDGGEAASAGIAGETRGAAGPAHPAPPTSIAATLGEPLGEGYVPPGFRRPEPDDGDDVDLPPARKLLVVDETELPPQAAAVRGELERRFGRTLALAGHEDFAAQVSRLERAEEGLAVRVCVEGAAQLRRRSGELPGSLRWCANTMRQYLGEPELDAAAPPLPPPGCPEWERVRDALQKRVRDEQFRRWFAPLRGRMVDGLLVLEAPDGLHAMFVRDNYAAFLADRSREALGGAVTVEVVGGEPQQAAAGGA